MAVGFDLSALMAIGAASGCSLPALAALLPPIEAAAINALNQPADEDDA